MIYNIYNWYGEITGICLFSNSKIFRKSSYSYESFGPKHYSNCSILMKQKVLKFYIK